MMRQFDRWLVALTIVALVAVSALPAGAGGRWIDREAPAQPDHDYYTVKLSDPPLASYTGGVRGIPRTKPQVSRKINLRWQGARRYQEHLAARRQDYKRFLQSAAPRATVAREFSVVFNGMGVKLNGENPRTLSQGPNVAAVSKSFVVRPAMNVSPGLINATAVWTALGVENAGAGIKVGIIDTGIDLTSPFLSDTGYPLVSNKIDACLPLTKQPGGANVNNKVIVCRVYASGVAPGASAPAVLLFFDHGTHVAGTVAGNNNTDAALVTGTTVTIDDLSGIAPRALLGDYNVFPGFGSGFIGRDGEAWSHDIAAALEDAVADGMDVVNMSLGGRVQGPHDFLAEATNATVEAGVIAAVAAGNEGPGDSTVSSPGSAAQALTAGASTNPHFVGIPATGIEPDGAFAFGAALGDFANFVPPVAADYTVTAPANGCTTISTNLSGKIALIDRGVCTFSTKIRNAQTAGAAGVLIVNNVAGDPVGMAQDGTPNQPVIPAAMLGKNEGNSIKPLGSVTVNGTAPDEFLTANADIIAGFSSRGPTPFTYLIKPDVTAPGVNVLSSVFEGEFAFFQGTSMATPHVAGAAALLLGAHPSWSPADVKSALVNTAKRDVFSHTDGSTPVGVLARGGGRIDLANANTTPLTFNPASVSFGFWGGNKNVQASIVIAVKNVSASVQNCTVGVTGPTIVTSPASLNVSAGASATLAVSLAAGNANQTDSGDYTGDVELNCTGGMLQIPWWVRIDRGGKP